MEVQFYDAHPRKGWGTEGRHNSEGCLNWAEDKPLALVTLHLVSLVLSSRESPATQVTSAEWPTVIAPVSRQTPEIYAGMSLGGSWATCS